MALAYTRDFLIDVFVSRFEPLGKESMTNMRAIANKTYDEFGKDTFRKLSSVTPEAIRTYKAKIKNV